MKAMKRLFYLLPAVIVLLLAAAPALRAAAQVVGPNRYFLPVILKPGGSGSTGMLQNGGKVEGPGGVGVGALTNTLDAPVEVSISAATTPTIPVPAPAQVLGDFYMIGASEDLLVSPEQPLILAMPLPPGADQTHLALVLLHTAEGVNDVQGNASAWLFQEGMVDPNRGLFLTTLAGLTQAGQTMALVHHPDFDSPPTDAPPPSTTGADRPTGAIFRVRCINFANPANCTPTTEAEAANHLSAVYSRLHEQLGFNRPRLRFLNETLHYDPNSLTGLGYTTYIEPYDYPGFCDPVSAAGYYSITSGRLVLCLDPAEGFDEVSLEVLVHEYFHATQYAYLATLADYFDRSQEKWVIEGMAASAMESYLLDQMRRTDAYGELHDVDLSLKTFGSLLVPYEYQAQDFWVYYGQRNGLSLAYLESVLEQGANSQAVIDTLDNGSVLTAYWDWVKNHVMEPEVDYDGLLRSPCQLETEVVVLPEEVTFGGYSSQYHDVSLEPLAAVVVDIRWDWDGYQFAEGRVFPNPSSVQDAAAANQALQFKFYEEADPLCATYPDRGRTYNNPDPGKRYYLVISNINPHQSFEYRVGFEIYPYPP